MGSDKRTANAVGGKTARACDSCVLRRASWYCAADDAFLCQPCDLSVHSANPLARRHHRLRLNASPSDHKPYIPTWPRGINSKPRTPRRHGKHSSHSTSSVVPQLDDQRNNLCGKEDEDELLYRVPMLDHTKTNIDSLKSSTCSAAVKGDHSVLFPDLEMDEFAADVETLLGEGLDGEISYGIEELGLLDYHEEDYFVPVKAGNEEPFELSFDYNYYSCLEVADETVTVEETRELETQRVNGTGNCGKISLRLDYKGIRAAWASKGSPWVDGEKPQINLDDHFWTHLTMEDSRKVLANGERGISTSGGGGREARVWRYKEKRRKRLFSKKIRYEVRKLNAEKRPRLKGRFVKTCS